MKKTLALVLALASVGVCAQENTIELMHLKGNATVIGADGATRAQQEMTLKNGNTLLVPSGSEAVVVVMYGNYGNKPTPCAVKVFNSAELKIDTSLSCNELQRSVKLIPTQHSVRAKDYVTAAAMTTFSVVLFEAVKQDEVVSPH